jgi:hypothetical protein
MGNAGVSRTERRRGGRDEGVRVASASVGTRCDAGPPPGGGRGRRGRRCRGASRFPARAACATWRGASPCARPHRAAAAEGRSPPMARPCLRSGLPRWAPRRAPQSLASQSLASAAAHHGPCQNAQPARTAARHPECGTLAVEKAFWAPRPAHDAPRAPLKSFPTVLAVVHRVVHPHLPFCKCVCKGLQHLCVARFLPPRRVQLQGT